MGWRDVEFMTPTDSRRLDKEGRQGQGIIRSQIAIQALDEGAEPAEVAEHLGYKNVTTLQSVLMNQLRYSLPERKYIGSPEQEYDLPYLDINALLLSKPPMRLA